MHEYPDLVGKQKLHVYYDLGLDFNFFPSTIWTYELHRNWFGIKTILIVYFKDDVVEKVTIKKHFFKLKL